MHSSSDLLEDLQRLQRAIQAVSDELDEIERRPRCSLQAVEEAASGETKGIEQAVANFAFAVAGKALV